MAKPAGFWQSDAVHKVIQEYIDGKITAQEAYDRLGLDDGRKSSPEAVMNWYVRERRKRLGRPSAGEAEKSATTSGSPIGETIWTFEPVCPDAYSSASPKVFIVGVEPNDEGLRPGRRDMGLWFCTARGNGYWGNPMFYRVTLLQLRAILDKPVESPHQAEEDLSSLANLRYLDLKGVGGGAAVRRRQMVDNWVTEHLQQVVHYWAKDRPDATILQGGHAQLVFEKIVAPALRDQHIEVQRVGLPHPSQTGYNLAALREARSHLRPLGEPLLRWAPRKKPPGWEELGDC